MIRKFVVVRLSNFRMFTSKITDCQGKNAHVFRLSKKYRPKFGLAPNGWCGLWGRSEISMSRESVLWSRFQVAVHRARSLSLFELYTCCIPLSKKCRGRGRTRKMGPKLFPPTKKSKRNYLVYLAAGQGAVSPPAQTDRPPTRHPSPLTERRRGAPP